MLASRLQGILSLPLNARPQTKATTRCAAERMRCNIPIPRVESKNAMLKDLKMNAKEMLGSNAGWRQTGSASVSPARVRRAVSSATPTRPRPMGGDTASKALPISRLRLHLFQSCLSNQNAYKNEMSFEMKPLTNETHVSKQCNEVLILRNMSMHTTHYVLRDRWCYVRLANLLTHYT